MNLDKNTKLLLIGGGVLIAMPLIKGVASLFHLAGNIVAFPGKIYDFFFENDKDFPPKWTFYFQPIYDKVLKVFKNRTYNPNDPAQREVMNAIKNSKVLNAEEKGRLIAVWVLPKQDAFEMWKIKVAENKIKTSGLIAIAAATLLFANFKSK